MSNDYFCLNPFLIAASAKASHPQIIVPFSSKEDRHGHVDGSFVLVFEEKSVDAWFGLPFFGIDLRKNNHWTFRPYPCYGYGKSLVDMLNTYKHVVQ